MKVCTPVLATLAAIAQGANIKRAEKCEIVSRATDAADVLISQYAQDTGMWGPTDGDELNGGTWWTSANMIEQLIDLYTYVPSKKDEYTKIVENTFKQAQLYNLGFQSGVEDQIKQLEETTPTPATKDGWLNDFTDDELWWLLAWLRAYDKTGNENYVQAGKNIFDHLVTAWDTTSCSGLLWGYNSTYVNAISNELFISGAASMANRVGESDKQFYADWANKAWDWFKDNNMWNSNGTINDGLLENCDNNNDVVWSYNQGVLLGGLVELAKLNGDDSLLEPAHDLAAAAIKQLSQDGILHDKCEPTCGDGSLNAQFKGIFIRNLNELNDASPKSEYTDFINKNAQSIWENNRNSDGMFGEVWSGPMAYPTVSSHSSAFDCLISAINAQQCTQ